MVRFFRPPVGRGARELKKILSFEKLPSNDLFLDPANFTDDALGAAAN
jgi:hypothetical protein